MKNIHNLFEELTSINNNKKTLRLIAKGSLKEGIIIYGIEVGPIKMKSLEELSVKKLYKMENAFKNKS